MEGQNLAALENHGRTLTASPLFNLSLASKELFHSNFLAWLCEIYPSIAGPLFARFTKAPCSSCDSLEVHREQRKIDLTIGFPNGEWLIVENKVKSLPSLEQLKEYSDKVKNKEHTNFLLLSLTRPSFLPSNAVLVEVNGTPWHYLSYSDLVGQLEPTIDSIFAINKYHSELLSDYLDFVRSLVAIASHFSVDSHYENADFFGRQETELLKKVRLYDLIDKIRYGQLAQMIKKTLESEGCRVVAKGEFWAATRGTFMLDSALYQGQTLCEFKYLAKDGALPVALGVMLQGNAVKVFVQADKSQVRKFAQELMSPRDGSRVWFDLARIGNDSREMPAAGFNQYSGICLYRYKKIAHSSAKGLVDLLIGYTRSIRHAEDTLASQIASACASG